MNDAPDAKPPTQGIRPIGKDFSEFGEVTMWSTYSYAPEWFEDALEVSTKPGATARRHEIIFSVCLAESYLFEWVRDTALKKVFRQLGTYFPPGQKKGITEKIKEIPNLLASNGCISGGLDCSNKNFQDFRKLVTEYRDGLIHATASRPSTAGLSAKNLPVPSKEDLDSLAPGWALSVVLSLLRKLHEQSDTPMPDWLLPQ